MTLMPLVISLLSLLLGHDDAELVFVGDAMQHQGQLDAARRPGGKWDYDSCFRHVAMDISNADYAVVNLETPLGPKPHTGYPCFNAPAEWADALAEAGFDLFLTANNHTLDRRSGGLRATADSLDRRGISHIGTYAHDSIRARTIPFVRSINNIKVGFLNYTYGTNGFTPSGDVVVDYIRHAQMARDIAATRGAGAEIVCVCMHWGDEYRLTPNDAQRREADFLERQGVDIIIGGHPHVVQPLEFRPNQYFPHKDLFIAWSVGNFISNMRTADTRGGLLARVWLHRGEDGIARVHGGEYQLLFTIPAGVPSGSNYRVVPAMATELIPASFLGHRDAFVRNARGVMKKHCVGVGERK